MHLPQSRRRRAGGVPWVTVSAYRPLASSSPAEIIEMYMLSPKRQGQGEEVAPSMCSRTAICPTSSALGFTSTPPSLEHNSPFVAAGLACGEGKPSPSHTVYPPWELMPTVWTFWGASLSLPQYLLHLIVVIGYGQLSSIKPSGASSIRKESRSPSGEAGESIRWP